MIKRKIKLKPVTKIVIGFLSVIAFGTFLLCLPFSQQSGNWGNFIDMMFTSVSSVCVTGLSSVNVLLNFTTFGKIVILFLIQIGGLGFVAMTTFVFLILGKKITFEKRLTIKESLNQDNIQGIVKLIKKIIIFVFATEFIGTIVLSFSFIPMYGFWQGIAKSIFMSISAFCNAGFDVISYDSSSVSLFYNNPAILLPISFLVIIGGFGFLALFEIPNLFKGKKLSLYSKLVISLTLIFLIGGTFLFAVFEWNNADTIGNMSVWEKLLNSFFLSVNTRTAGFSSFSLSELSGGSIVVSYILMFIGGNSASTAGGLKLTTFFILLLVIFKNLSNENNLVFCQKKISSKTINKCFKLLILALVYIMTSILIISTVEGLGIQEVLFEVISAYSTVGLSLGITSTLSVVSKLILMLLMFAGRVGPLTLNFVVVKNSDNVLNNIEYPDSKIIVG